MFAVIATGGKQYKVEENDVLSVEKLNAAEGEEVAFPALAISDDQGFRTGNPVPGAVVTASVLEHGRGKKLYVMTYKPKKRVKRKLGHRQPYTKVRITAIRSGAPNA